MRTPKQFLALSVIWIVALGLALHLDSHGVDRWIVALLFTVVVISAGNVLRRKEST